MAIAAAVHREAARRAQDVNTVRAVESAATMSILLTTNTIVSALAIANTVAEMVIIGMQVMM